MRLINEDKIIDEKALVEAAKPVVDQAAANVILGVRAALEAALDQYEVRVQFVKKENA